MKTLVVVAVACLIPTTVDCPTVLATPGAPPEVPQGGRMVFTDNPAIVDPQPTAIESYSRAADGNAVAVNFTSGTPACSGVHATVAESPDSVTVDLLGGTLPEAVGRMCIMLAVHGTLEVPLKAPLGDRQVLSAS